MINVALRKNLLTVFLLFVLCESASAEDEISFDYEVKTEKKGDEASFFGAAESILDNPVLAGGLNSGTDAINRSIDSLIESLFYSLLDNERSLSIATHTNFAAGLERRVIGSVIGKNVIIDRFRAGPRYEKLFYKAHNIPVSLNADLTANMYDIYLRSNPMRIAESQELPIYRWVLNNWLGFLPFLSYVLPPSFNPNELYDPINQFSIPFTFPSDASSFNAMSVGNIKSYSITNGISVPIDLVEIVGAKKLSELSQSLSFDINTPFALFVTGSYRINVLKKNEHTAWVALSSRTATGQSFKANIGNQILLFTKALSQWPGLGAGIYPFDLALYDAKETRFDHIYEFNMRSEDAVFAYKKAVGGDFLDAYKSSKQNNPSVKYHFAKKSKGDSVSWSRNRKFFVEQASTKAYGRSELVEVNEENEHYFLFESTKELSKETTNILTGSEKMNYFVKGVIPVVKSGNKYRYKNPISPFHIEVMLESNDSYSDVREYREHRGFLQKLTHLKLEKLPTFNLFNPQTQRKIQQKQPLYEPDLYIKMQRPVPMLLGKLNTQTRIRFEHSDLIRVFSKTDDQLWSAFAEAYNVKKSNWMNPKVRESLTIQASWLTSALALPLRMLNMNTTRLESLQQAYFSIKALRALQSAKNAYEARNALSELLDTEYLYQLCSALISLSDYHSKRSISFFADSHGKGSTKSARRKFQKINDLVIKSSQSTPEMSNYDLINNKLAQLSPTSVSRQKPPYSIEKIQLANLASQGQNASFQKNLFLRAHIAGNESNDKVKLYVRFEHASKLQLGNFVLSEYVFIPKKSNKIIDLFLTGKDSKLDNLFSKQTLALGGEFKITLAIGAEDGAFSNEKSIFFNYKNGKLLPPKE